MNKQQEKLILDHMGFADYLAVGMGRKIPKFITLDELKSAAYEGLISAVKNYDYSTKFTTYSALFIKGAMLDYIRDLTKSRRKHKINFVSMESKNDSNDKSIGENLCDEKSFVGFSNDLFDALKNVVSHREMWVLKAHYVEEKNLQEISKILNIKRPDALISNARKKILRFFRENRNNRHSFAYECNERRRPQPRRGQFGFTTTKKEEHNDT